MDEPEKPAIEKRLFYSQKELAKMCGVSITTIWRWDKSGEIPSPVIVGGKPRWLVCDIEKWLAKLKRSSV